MDIRQLEAFVYTVKYQSFSLAAQKLYLSQPTVSSHINNLEKELHTQLLKRTTKSLSVTPAGQTLYNYAAEILNLQQKAILELSDKNSEAAAHRCFLRSVPLSSAGTAVGVPSGNAGCPLPYQLLGQSGCYSESNRWNLRYRAGRHENFGYTLPLSAGHFG